MHHLLVDGTYLMWACLCQSQIAQCISATQGQTTAKNGRWRIQQIRAAYTSAPELPLVCVMADVGEAIRAMGWFKYIRRQETTAYSTFYIVLILVSFAAGISLTYWLSGLNTVPTAKILNLAGIAYSVIGVLVLSEAIVQSERIKHFMVVRVGTALLWAHTGLAIGALIGAGITFIVVRPSAHAAYSVAFSLWGYLMLVGGVVDATVTNPLTERLGGEMAARHQRLGLIILVTGMTLQLAAAILDF